MLRYVSLLCVLLLVVGCKEKTPSAPAGPGPVGGGNPHIDYRPPGGSSTVLGKARDRALDIRLMNEFSQVKTGLDADGVGVPANRAAWILWLKDYATVRTLVDRGEVITFSRVTLGDANTVMMYEKRIETDPDAIVLTADGKAHRMNKAQFATLNKPSE